jgi:hypothetical protein
LKMKEEFFDEFSLQKKRVDYKKGTYVQQMLKQKEKTQKAEKMDEEIIYQVPKNSRFGNVEGASRRITLLVHRFLARRRAMNGALDRLSSKVKDLESLLSSVPGVKQKPFMNTKLFAELTGLFAHAWLAGLKHIFHNCGDKKRYKNNSEKRKQSLALLQRLSELVLLAFERKSNQKASLLVTLLQQTDTNIKFLLSLLSFIKILIKIDNSLEFILNTSLKKSIANIFFNCLDVEELIFHSKQYNLPAESQSLIAAFSDELFEKLNIDKCISNSMGYYLKCENFVNPQMISSYILSTFSRFYFGKFKSFFHGSVISPLQLQSLLAHGLEISLGVSLVGKYFYSELLSNAKLEPIFTDILENLPADIIRKSQSHSVESKHNLVINLLHISMRLLAKPESEELY